MSKQETEAARERARLLRLYRYNIMTRDEYRKLDALVVNTVGGRRLA